jgi:hypothetical protein
MLEKVSCEHSHRRESVCVDLHKGDGSRKRFLVHRLVLLAFVGPCPEGMECRHFPDRDVTNNNLDNLQWGTKEENAADKVIHGTTNRGSRCGSARFNEVLVEKVRKLYKTGDFSQKQLGFIIGTTQGHVSMMVNNKIW